MYAGVNILIFLFLFSKMNVGISIPQCVYDACERIVHPEYLTTSCCSLTDRLIDVINDCRGESPTIETCEQATCVVSRYGVLTDGKVDYKKAEEAIITLNAANPAQSGMNDKAGEFCLQSNYTCFPSKVPDCPNMKFMNCAFFAYRIACPDTYSTCECDDILEDVATCKPYQTRYVRELNRGCSRGKCP